jgi:26S proteasome regulatory subunit T4
LSQKRKLTLVAPPCPILIKHRGLFAIKDYRDSINQDDFNKAVRKMAESKKLEGKLDYQKL